MDSNTTLTLENTSNIEEGPALTYGETSYSFPEVGEVEVVSERQQRVAEARAKFEADRKYKEGVSKRERAYSAWDRFNVSRRTSETFSGNLSNLFERYTGLNPEVELWNPVEGYHLPTINSLKDKYKEYGLDKEWETAYAANDTDKMIEVQQKFKHARNKAFFGDIYAGDGPQTLADSVGTLVGYLEDPTTLLPGSTSAKGASTLSKAINMALWGSSVGGIDAAVHQVAQKGDVDWDIVGLAAGIGAVAPVALFVGGPKVVHWIKDKATRTNRPIQEVAEEVEQAVVKDLTPQTTTEIKLIEATVPESVPPKTVVDVPGSTPISPELKELYTILEGKNPGLDLIYKNADEISSLNQVVSFQWRPVPGDETKLMLVDAAMPDDAFRKLAKERWDSYPAAWKHIGPFDYGGNQYVHQPLLARPLTEGGYPLQTMVVDPNELPFKSQSFINSDLTVSPGITNPDYVVVHTNVFYNEPPTKVVPTPPKAPDLTTSPGAAAVDTPHEYNVRGFWERPMTEEETAWTREGIDLAWMHKEANDAISRLAQEEAAYLQHAPMVAQEALDTFTRKTQTIFPKINSSMQNAFEQLQKRDQIVLGKILNGQSGQISTDMAVQISSSSIGAATGYYFDGVEGAIAGGVAGAAFPYVVRGIGKGTKSVKDWAARDYTNALALARYRAAPVNMIRGYGEAGRTIATYFTRWKEDVSMAIGARASEIADVLETIKLRSFGKDQRKTILATARGIVDGSVDPATASHESKVVATKFKEILSGILDEAEKVGVYTKEAADRLRAIAGKRGYFPRVWDNVMFDSEKGRELFVSKLVKDVGFTEDAARNTLKSLFGDEDKYIDSLIALSRGKDGKVYFSRKRAFEILDSFDKTRKKLRSSHLDYHRKIHVDSEALLEDFLVKDPLQALEVYFDDVYRRIKGVQYFDSITPDGKHLVDGKIRALLNRVEETSGREAKNVAEQAYYTLQRDGSRSEVLMAQINLGSEVNSSLRKLHAFTTITKLSLMALPNLFQSMIFGTTKILGSKASTPAQLKSIKTAFFHGLGSLGSGEWKKFANRAGAATDLTLMELYTEGSGQIGKYTERALKMFGYYASERFNRTLGSNLGREYALELMERYTNHTNGTQKLTGKKLDGLLAAMKELDLPVNRPVAESDIYRAGLRFSNEINFTNAPDKLPMAWQHPMGKLLTKFKSFSFHTGAFIRDNVIKPAVRDGNFKPLAFWLSASAAIGVPIDSIRNMIKGDDKDYTNTERFLRGFTTMGGFGLMQDYIQSLGASPTRFITNLAGPIVSQISEIAGGVVEGVTEAVTTGNLSKVVTRPMEAAVSTFVYPGHKTVAKVLEDALSDRQSSRASVAREQRMNYFEKRNSQYGADYYKQSADYYKQSTPKYAEGGLVSVRKPLVLADGRVFY